MGDTPWVITQGSLMMALRSNAPHYWAWARLHAARHLPAELLAHSGLLVGDPHHENFSCVFLRGVRSYVPNDLDDSGVGPFVLDIAKLLAVSRAVDGDPAALNTAAVLDCYRQGLAGADWSHHLPKLLKQDFEVTPEQLAADYAARVRKKTHKGAFLPEDGMTSWSAMSVEEREQFAALEHSCFRHQVLPGYEIRDRALYRKQGGGGSAGIPRYWLYLKNAEGERQFIEFKQLGSSALALYQPQPGTVLDRTRHMLATYWGDKPPAWFGVEGHAELAFWMRPKLPGYVDVSGSELARKPGEFSQLTCFVAHHLGRWHGKQAGSGAYAKSLAAPDAQLATRIDQLVQAYLVEARHLHPAKH